MHVDKDIDINININMDIDTIIGINIDVDIHGCISTSVSAPYLHIYPYRQKKNLTKLEH